MKGVLYRGVWLWPGSQALALHQEGKLKALDAHMRNLDDEGKARGEFR